MLGRILTVLVSIAVGLLALELGLRAWDGMLGDWSNLVVDARSVLAKTEGQRFRADELVGFVPKDGLRSNGAAAAPGENRILAVGDSYTYGEEVNDDETWPALLQAATGRPVLNGGVSGYGFDQTVLRAEQLAGKEHPATIVVSFIADDIRRTEMRRIWGAQKPYFDIEKNALVLRNVPVPPRPEARTTLTFWQRTLGYSYLFDFVLRRLDQLHDWFGDHLRVHAEGTGEKISCLLAARLAELQRVNGAKVLVLAEYDPVVWDEPKLAPEQRRLTQGLLGCARKNGLATLDSYDAIAATPKPRALYKLWHMNKDGNRLIATLVAKALETNGK